VRAPCEHCGATSLVAVLLPGHAEVEAIVCLRCGRAQQGLTARPGPQAAG
jgi:transcription elongation factor Elf1